MFYVHRSWFLFCGVFLFFVFFLVLIVADFSKRLWNFKNLTPFSKLGFPPGRRSPLKLLGKLCKEEEAAVELCMQQNCTKE